MSQTQDTFDNAAAAVDVDRVPRPDYKKDAGELCNGQIEIAQWGGLNDD